MKIFKSKLWIILISYLLATSLCKNKMFYERMSDGTFIVAFPEKMAKDEDALRHQLGKHFHLPKKRTNNNHEYINFDLYPKTDDELNINNSKDKAILTNLKNLCLGSEMSDSSKINKLQKFKKGYCSPVVVVPGILATSLILNIDCQKLKQYNDGVIFQSCGWTSCSALGMSIPDQNYLLWVGLQLSLKVTRGYSKCFGDLFGILYDTASTSDNFGSRYSMAAGLKSTWFGNTQSSKQYSDCGANAIRDLSGYVSMLSVLGSQCALNDFGRLIDMLKAMGYQTGVTLQPLPYDFRYGILASTTPTLLPQIINNLYYATGKKVVVVGHSLGTLHTLNGLAYFLTQQQKDKMVRHYIPITPPWAGTVSAIRNMLYGDPSYFTKGLFDSGINKYAQMKFSTASGSTYDLFLRDAFHRFRDEPWMKQVVERIKYEKQPRRYEQMQYNKSPDQENGQQDYPMSWFPSKYEQCFPRYFKKNYYCETGFVNFLQQPIFEINGSKYYGNQSDITRLVVQNLPPAQAQSALSLWSQTKVPGKTLRDLPAPGVNTSIIFTTLYDTQIYYKYQSRPKDDVFDQNTFIQPTKIGSSPGDVSVPSWSALLFAAKWIHNKTNGNYSVNVIQYCSNYSRVRDIYSSIPCQCSKNPFKNQLDCTHPCIISDKYILAFVLGILTNKQKGYSDENVGSSVIFKEEQLKKRIKQCVNLKPNNYLNPVSKNPTFSYRAYQH